MDPRRFVSLDHANQDERALAIASVAAARGNFRQATVFYNTAYLQSTFAGNMYSGKLFRGPTTEEEMKRFCEAAQRRQSLKLVQHHQQQQQRQKQQQQGGGGGGGGGAGADEAAAPPAKRAKRKHKAKIIELSYPLLLSDLRSDSIPYDKLKAYKKDMRAHGVKVRVPVDQQTTAGYRAALIKYFTKTARIRAWSPPSS